MSPINTDLKDDLGYAGVCRTDPNDEPFSLSVILSISHLPDLLSTQPRWFYYEETREWFPLRPFSIFIFRGIAPHGGIPTTVDVRDYEGKKYWRIDVILYPNCDFLSHRKQIIPPQLPEQYRSPSDLRLCGYSFYDDGEWCFGTKEYYQSWCATDMLRDLDMGKKKAMHLSKACRMN